MESTLGSPVLRSAESRWVWPDQDVEEGAEEKSPGPMRMSKMVENNTHLRLVGKFRDVLGAEHHVDERLDLRELWAIFNETPQRLQKRPAEEIGRHIDQLREEIRRHGERVSGTGSYAIFKPMGFGGMAQQMPAVRSAKKAAKKKPRKRS